MEDRMTAVTDHYKERIERLGIFDCLYRLENKKTKDRSGKIIDFFSLGLLTLLFFFENMLMRNKRTGVRELADFLYNLNQGEIDLDREAFLELARSLIETFRPPGGRKNYKTFYNWETRRKDQIEYSYLKASKSDIKSNTQYYTLDEHGLELVFATKEYFSEFQLSINQLLLRKQLEKGEFIGALRQIDEMRIDVENLEDRMAKIKHEVQRNILSEKTYERYQELIEDINSRLIRENEEFDELTAFVNQTRDALSYDLKNDKDIRAFDYIIRIQRELGEVHGIHRNLLQKSIELKTTTLQSAQESLYYVGMESFNFQKEIVSRLFSSPLPLEATRTLINPLLYQEKQQNWSPITVFAPQRLVNKSEEEKSSVFLTMKPEDLRQKELEIQQRNFGIITAIMIEAMGDQNRITLESLINIMKEGMYAFILEDLLFYHFFMILHQKSPLELKQNQEEQGGLMKQVIEKLKRHYRRIHVTETQGVIHFEDRYSIKNMQIELEEKDFVL